MICDACGWELFNHYLQPLCRWARRRAFSFPEKTQLHTNRLIKPALASYAQIILSCKLPYYFSQTGVTSDGGYMPFLTNHAFLHDDA